jgi:hypothetical protein
MQAEMNQLLSDNADSSLALNWVIDQLNEALRLFADGETDHGCLCLAEAHRALGCCGKANPGTQSAAPRPGPKTSKSEETSLVA